MKKQFAFLLIFTALFFGFATSFVASAAANELSTSITLSADPTPGGVPILNVLPSTTYTHTISITNNLASKAPIVKIVLRLPDPFVMVDPVVCPPNWTEVSTQNNGRGVGMINCVENGLDTSISNPTSNPQYDLAYGQTTSVSYSFTSPSVNGTTDLALQVFYINSSGLMQGTWFNGSYAPAQIVVETPVAVVVSPPTCTSWAYSNWSSCSSDGSQTRNAISSSPNSCTGGSPVVSQSCTYVPPTPVCTSSDWSCGVWGSCSTSGNQTKTCTKISNCQGGTPPPSTSQSCAYLQPSTPIIPVAPVTPPTVYQAPQPSCTADTWSCDGWNSCSLSGVQNRSCRKTFDCPNVETAPPVADQYCEAPNKPVQQVPQDSNAISNQDNIIKATVKLLCPIDEKRAMQGSGTVIDSAGTILTNKHVIDGTPGCWVVFVNEFDDEPYFEEGQGAILSKVSSTEDVAILKLNNPRNKKLAYVDITKTNSNFRLGTKVNIYGYPAKFGTNITYTSGDFSGTSGSYLKTTAIIEHGNSGGGSYLNDGSFIGVPTAVIKGELNAMGQILSINAINAWLGNSTIAYKSNGNQNNYSRVSALEDIDIKKLDSLKLFIPQTDNKGNNTIIVVPQRESVVVGRGSVEASAIKKVAEVKSTKSEINGSNTSNAKGENSKSVLSKSNTDIPTKAPEATVVEHKSVWQRIKGWFGF